MSSKSVSIRGENLIFTSLDQIEQAVEHRIKHRYGSGIFVQDFTTNSNKEVFIKLGTSYPKDVSDRRENDRVLKYINITDVLTLEGESTGNGYYTVRLPERSNLKQCLSERREEMTDRLDWSMAKSIYQKVYQLNPVRNQLNSLIQIVRWIRREPELLAERIDNMQGTPHTQEYLDVLETFDYLQLNEGVVRPGEKIEAVIMQDNLSLERYEEIVVGNIISDAYNVLRNQRDLRMLNHFPKYANAYYYSAIQRQKPDLWLDTEAMQSTLSREWNDNVDPLVLEDKLRDLDSVDVIEKDGDFVTGNEAIFSEVSADVSA